MRLTRHLHRTPDLPFVRGRVTVGNLDTACDSNALLHRHNDEAAFDIIDSTF